MAASAIPTIEAIQQTSGALSGLSIHRSTREFTLQALIVITLVFAAFCVSAQEAGKSASGSLAEFNTAIAAVMKIPVVLNSKGKKTESFCKRPDTLNKAELKKLQVTCEKIFSDTAIPEVQRVAAKYILGKSKTQYNASDLAARYCDDAAPLLKSVSEYYDQKNISGSGPHEAMASCLVLTERYDPALEWIEHGIKRKETSQLQYYSGISWLNLQELTLAKTALERSIALDENNEAAKQSLAQTDKLIEQARQAPPAKKTELSINDSQECKAWKSAIVSNRSTCDSLIGNSYDEFFSCMDVGMTISGYGPRSDEQTQIFYRSCGLSSWTDESLKP